MKNKQTGTNIHLEQPYYLHPKSWKYGGSVFGTGFAGGTKQSNPLHVISQIFRFGNYCLQVIIMGDYKQLLV